MRGAQLLLAGGGAVALLGVSAALAPAASAPRHGSRAGYENALVAVRPTARAAPLLRNAGARPVARSLGIWRLPAGRAKALEPALRRAGLLRYVEPDRPQQEASFTTGDPLAAPDVGWHLYTVGADQATPPGPGIPLTIVDSGLDTSHVEFRNRPNTVLLDAQPVRTWGTDLYHGTKVSSVAAAPADGVGAIGVYPTALLQEYALTATAFGASESEILRGITTAAAAGRSVINLSLAGSTFSRAEYEAVLGAVRRGALVVAAAGNEAGATPEYPGALTHVLTVASTGPTNLPSPFSNRGPAIDLAAPGEAIPVQHPSDPAVFERVSGTSFSSPIVAAAAAWVWTLHPELDAGQVADILRASARDVWTVGPDDRTGYGVLDLPAALAAQPGSPDLQEPNDDIDQVAPGRLFASGQPTLTTRTKLSVRLSATIDRNEDPSDVYRLVVPAGRKLTATVTGSTDIGATLWDGGARTVVGTRSGVTRFRLAVSNRAGERGEQVFYRNTGRSAVTVYLQVWLAAAGERHATYTMSVVSR
jgi:hypothetical protein